MRLVFFSAILEICTITNLVIKNVDVSSEKAVANTYDDGLYSDRTTTSNSDHVVSSGLTAAYMYDDGLYSDRTTTSNSDHVVSSGLTAAYMYDDGLYSDRTTTSNSDHVVSSGLTAAYMHDDGLYPKRTTTSNSDYVVSSVKKASKTYADALYPKRTTSSSYEFNLYPDMTITSNSDHRISLGQTEANTYDEGLYPERTSTSSYEFDVYPDMTATSNSDHRISLGQTAANTYEKGFYPERTSTSNFGYAVFPNGSLLYRHDHRVYPVSSTRFKYEQGEYPRRAANSVYQEKMSTSKYTNDLNHERVIKSNVYHSVFPEVYAKKTTTSKYEHGAFPDGTTMYDFDRTEDKHHQGQRQTITNKYSLGIHLKRFKRFMSGYGVYPDQITTSLFDNSMKLEWTTIYNNAHRVYPKGFRASKYSHSVDQDRSTENLYENSVTRDPEETTRIVRNGVYNQEFKEFLQECKNGTVIQKLLCYPTLTYNISLVNGVIPYFSDLRIFFADNFQNCNDLFNKFIKTKNNVVSNADVHDFLTNDSTCLEFASFTNKNVFLIKLNDRGSLFSGFTFPYEKTSNIKLYVILRQHSCRCGFNHCVNMNSTQLSDVISIDKLIDFSQGNDCVDVRFFCNKRHHFYDNSIFVPDSEALYLHIGVAVEVTIVNGFVLFIFLQRRNRTPVTILLSFLAVSDVNMVILFILPACIAPQEHVENYSGLSYLYLFDFPKCLIYTFIDELKYAFHLSSVFITTLLCLQKTTALLFPMWSKRRLNNRVSIICSVAAFFISICIYSPKLLEQILSINNFNGRCCSTLSSDTLDYHYTITNICFLVSCLVVALCTVYIICKLTYLRRNLPWTDSPIVQKRNRMSAITVVAICIIFLLSESVLIVTSFTFMLVFFKPSYVEIYRNMHSALRRYTDLILIFGCSLNFIVYIVMSKQLRDKLVLGVVRIVR